ncbi:DUF3536 domain-containing protein [Vulgatibacter incomptus]|uniref:Alpha-amylase/alpha-mannosidase n=1 Tax=Vulgatibacter incomptus TaxID=1391653 RepID=A0A0K1PDJ2_9BACT|nr:DUF3536 domain-containing protein [Vulgatibacter incomptus]AKU91476.1 Alpha-amylase/alpha-mannosidase [Vulgatibacter incomptus]
MGRPLHLCIHGHFYQPPRENPWLEEVELQDSAAPFHDWNDRIAAECYGPNAAARILTPGRRITEVVNNYRSLSFNFGPTLLSWMERKRPEIYRAILEADRDSCRERGGHGNALAQAYNHSILPLEPRRDKRTQIRWGLADFAHRFGRKAEGMWLPETAVDAESLELMAAEGIRFTVLSPYQARRIRPFGRDEWESVEGGRVDPTRPYLVRLPNGSSIAVFFYDGPIAKGLAFEGGLSSADELLARLEGGFDPGRDHEELLSVAVDGETFGHHKKGGDEILAAALRRVEERGWSLTNYGQFLASHPPSWEVELAEPSSWSCSHGVERWRSNCGCSTSGQDGWHQKWRTPLRQALELLRDALAAQFEQDGGQLFQDPWEARDRYIELTLSRTPEIVGRWLEARARTPGLLSSSENRVQALRLLEAQRQAMRMFTSCGWFFNDVSNLETIQILRYAAKAMQLAREAGGPSLEPAFLSVLEHAPSNLPDLGNGASVYERFVRPSIASLQGIAAHHAIARLFDPAPAEGGRLFCYRFEQLAFRRETAGPATLSVGRTRLTSELTDESLDATVTVLHFGGTDFRCAVRAFTGVESHNEAEVALFDGLARFSLSDVVRGLDSRFVGPDFGLRHLFLDDRRALAGRLTRETQARCEKDYRLIFEANRSLMAFLLEINTPIPRELMAAAELSLSSDLRRAIEDLAEEGIDLGAATDRALQILAEARRLGARLALDEPRRCVEALVARRMREASAGGLASRGGELVELISLGDALGAGLDLSEPQNLFRQLLDAPLGPVERNLAVRLGEKLWFDREALERRLSGDPPSP